MTSFGKLTMDRYELAHLAENVDGRGSSSDAVSGSLPSNIRSVYDGEPYYPCRHGLGVKTTPMLRLSSMKFGTAASGTPDLSTKSSDSDTYWF